MLDECGTSGGSIVSETNVPYHRQRRPSPETSPATPLTIVDGDGDVRDVTESSDNEPEKGNQNLQTDCAMHDGGEEVDPELCRKLERKEAKKAKKAERRAQREGRGDPTAGQKQCDMCSKSVDLLIRCMYEEGQTDWKMVCGKCWKVASGGVVDGDDHHPHYRYGGLWKNRRAQK